MNSRETELVQRAMDGSESAFEDLCQSCAREVLYLCIKYMGTLPDGEDAAQEVFIKMQRSIGRLKQPESFRAWMHRIVSYTCLNMRRGAKGAVAIEELARAADVADEKNIDFLPAEFAEQQDKRQSVLDALDTLPHSYKQALLLFYFEDMSLKDIAVVLQTDVKSVQNLLYRARRRLRKQMEKQGVHWEGGLMPATGMYTLSRILQEDADAVAGAEKARKAALAARASGTPAAWTGHAAALAVLAVSGLGAVLLAGFTYIGSSYASPTPAFAAHAISPSMTHSGSTEINNAYSDYILPPSGQEPFFTQPAGPGAALGTPAQAAPAGNNTAAAPGGADISIAVPSSAGPGYSGNALPEASEGGDSGRESENPAGSHSAGTTTAPAVTTPATTPPAATTTTPASSASTTSMPGEVSTFVLDGRLLFVNLAGEVVEQDSKYAEGFLVQLFTKEGSIVAEAEADEEGVYQMQLTAPAGRYILRAQPGFGFALLQESIEVTIEAGAALPALAFTDSKAPTGSIVFYNAEGEDTSGSSVNPASAGLQAHDNTSVVVSWKILENGGGCIASGIGMDVDLALHLNAQANGTYEIVFTIKDAAGNCAQVRRAFLLLAVREEYP